MNPYTAYPMPIPGYPGDPYFNGFNGVHPPPTCDPHIPPPFFYHHPGGARPPIRPGTAQPTTRPHARNISTGDAWGHHYYGKFSPRYHSNGYYATAAPNVSRKCFWSGPRRMRSYSASQQIPGVDSSDEEELYGHVNLDTQWGFYRPDRNRPTRHGYNFRGHGTDYNYFPQAQEYAHRNKEEQQQQYNVDDEVEEEDDDDDDDVVEDGSVFVHETEEEYAPPRHQDHRHSHQYQQQQHHHHHHHHQSHHQANQHHQQFHNYSNNYSNQSTPSDHKDKSRRSRTHSTSIPKRSQTARPATTPRKPHQAPLATESDARKHHIPPGFSLKNWDPSEEPIMLLGSVFDANSLGKWIYDWTAYCHGPATPISEMAGELWLLLINLAGKIKRAEECMPQIRSEENKEMVDDFIESGDRLNVKLKKLLKECESPMLKASKSNRNSSQLGKKAGIEFVNSLFGRDRQLDSTEKFMASIRLWNLRFDANCEEILCRPTD